RQRLAPLPRGPQSGHDLLLLLDVLSLGDFAFFEAELQQEQIFADAIFAVQLALGHVLELLENEAKAGDWRADRGAEELEEHQVTTPERSSFNRMFTKLYGGQGPV